MFYQIYFQFLHETFEAMRSHDKNGALAKSAMHAAARELFEVLYEQHSKFVELEAKEKSVSPIFTPTEGSVIPIRQ